MKILMGIVFLTCQMGFAAPESSLWLSAETLLLDDGQPIETWEDKRGGNIQVTQSDENLRPIFRSIGINNRPSVEFYNTYLTFQDTIFGKGVKDLHYFAVIKPALRGGYETIFGAGSSGDFGLFCLYVGKLALYHPGMQPSSTMLGLTQLKTTDSYLLEVQKDNTSLTLILNGKVELQAQVNILEPQEFSNQRFIGGEGGENFHGQLGELILFESALSKKDVMAVRCRLGSIYEIGVEGCVKLREGF